MLYNSVTGDKIPFMICRNSSCGQNYTIGNNIEWTSTTLLGLLNLFTGPNGSLPLYIKTMPGANIAAGQYSSSIEIRWNWNICVFGVLYCVTYDSGDEIQNITVALDVRNDCSITAPNVNFGSAAFTDSFDAITQPIIILCSKGAAYTVGINDGLHGSAGSRHLSNGTNSIAYDLYYPASGQDRWGSLAGERVSSNEATTNGGSYNGVAGQSFTYKAEIIPGQPTPPGGIYTDTLTIDILF
ncbi:MAG: spore coat protein U [Sphingobium sp.]|nr:spore coat protein U [Sphingobium sp.]